MTLQKLDLDKNKNQYSYCSGYNTKYYNCGDTYEDVMRCKG